MMELFSLIGVQCDRCGFEQIAYNSCRDRHCPECQVMAKEKWLNDRKAERLPASYFHLVFTLPHDLNTIILSNKRTTLNILFAAVNDTLGIGAPIAKIPTTIMAGAVFGRKVSLFLLAFFVSYSEVNYN